jgi:hypothetical protein
MPDGDGDGPREESDMWNRGRRGKKAGHQKRNC